MDDPLRNLMTEKAFAESLGVCQSTVRKYRDAGMPFLRVGRRVLLQVAQSVDWLTEHCREVRG